MDDTHAFARSEGYVQTVFGRKCFIPSINDKNPMRRAGAERQAINAPIQGAAADIIKRSMQNINNKLMEKSIRANLILQVHDELVF